MKICFVSKYPPIEGYVSSYAYWLIRALGERGHTIHVVTNASEVDPQYKEAMDRKDTDYTPKGIILHTTVEDRTLGCIPIFNPFTEKLASLTLDIIQREDISVIDSWYLIPYGVAAFTVSLISGHPFVARTAGTDIERMCRSPQFKPLASSLFKHCSTIIGNVGAVAAVFSQYASKTLQPGVILNTDYFNLCAKPLDLKGSPKYEEGIPVITYVGKAISKKGFYKLTDVLSRICEPFLFLVVSDGGEFAAFKKHVKELDMEDRTLFLNFQPPWKMPLIYRASTVVVSLEHGELIGRAPFIPREAAACGCCTLISPEIHSKWCYRMLENGVHTVVADPENPKALLEAVLNLICNPEKAKSIGVNGHHFFSRLDNPKNHQQYIDKTVELYQRLRE